MACNWSGDEVDDVHETCEVNDNERWTERCVLSRDGSEFLRVVLMIL